MAAENSGEKLHLRAGQGRFQHARPRALSSRHHNTGGDVAHPLVRERPASKLPIPLTSLIGRAGEMAEVKRLLATTQLLTLTGPGGVGKTRLAQAVAADLVTTQTFRDGVWLVELAGLADPALVPQAVAAVLEVREQPGWPLGDTLVDVLQSKELLLVLDNCEHLVDACAQLAEKVLRICPSLQILSTSREFLGIAGETAWLVPPLALPESDQMGPAGAGAESTLGQYDAVRLFVERATAVQRTFGLTGQNAMAVVHVCRRLDGIPLAIELAAARVKVLPVEQIAERLDDCFRLLTVGSRTALPRHQTLQATIDWSYDLLSEKERAVFRRLAVFASGWTLEAVETVCAAEGVEQDEVFDLLSRLVDKSLVVMQEQGGNARYHLLETIRQYARERLHSAARSNGEAATIVRQHAHFFLALAEEAEPKLTSANRGVWLERLEVEHDNLRAALRWAVESRQAEIALRLAGALSWFWHHRGYLSEGRRWAEEALPLAGASGSPAARAKALYTAGSLAYLQADYATAHAVLEESVATWRELGAKHRLAYALTHLADATGAHGNYAVARSIYGESVALFREVGDKWGLAYTLGSLGDIPYFEGDYRAAWTLFEESLALFRELGDKWGIGWKLITLGATAYRQNEYTAAGSLLEEGVTLIGEVGDKWLHAAALRLLADLAQHQADYARAAALYAESLVLARELANKLFVAQRLAGLAGVATMEGQLERAARLFGAIQKLFDTGWLLSFIPPDRADYERNLRVVRTRLDEGTFEKAWMEGQAMTLEQVVAYALQIDNGRRTKDDNLSAVVYDPSPLFTQPVAQPELQIFALGLAQIYRGEDALTTAEWKYARPRELFFYLLCHPPRTKEQIGLTFWPDASPAQLRQSFHVTLHHLRRALGRPDWIFVEKSRYTFNRSLDYWFDVEAFEAHLAAARRLQAKAPAQAAHHLEEAVKLYRGDFLEDLVAGDWYLIRRQELRRLYLDALLDLGRLSFAEGDYVRAVDAYRQVIARDSYLEGAHRELMRCYARLGEPGQAMRHYQALVELLRDELGAPPAPETTSLFERLKRGEGM